MDQKQKDKSPEKTPAVTVVVPLYNKKAYVMRCLESIRRQGVEDFEAIVVDDGSTDGGGALAGKIGDSRFRLVTQNNRGEGAARNRGIAEAGTELVAFLDADDEWDPDFLEAVLRLYRKYPAAGLFATGLRRIMDGGGVREISLQECDSDGTKLIPDYFRMVRYGHFVSSSSVALRRSVLAEVGVFAEGEPIGADIDLWARIAFRYPVTFDMRILATYHSEAEGRSFKRVERMPPFPPVVRSLRKLLRSERLGGRPAGDINRYIDGQLINYAYWLLALGNSAVTRDFLQNEPLLTARYRREALLLVLGSRILPGRLIGAGVSMCKQGLTRLRNMTLGGRGVVVRDVPCIQPETMPAAEPADVVARKTGCKAV